MYRLKGQSWNISAALCFCLVLAFSLDCNRQEPWHESDSNLPSAQQDIPFHSDRLSTDDASPVLASNSPGGVPPFHAERPLRILPAGTLLTVELQNPLSTRKAHTGDTFRASTVSPFSTGGRLLLDRGTIVNGRVESTQLEKSGPGKSRDTGYFRLTLNGMTVDGSQITLQTSSLFARGNSSSSTSSVSTASTSNLGVNKGRRLTFRLTAPAVLPPA